MRPTVVALGLATVVCLPGCGKSSPTQPNPQPIPQSRFTVETVDSIGRVGFFPSLALDASGHPRIVYMDLDHQAIKFASKDTAGWVLETVGGSPQYDGFTSIALDAAGNPHVTYAGPTGLMYAVKSGSSWNIETIDGNARETTGYVTSNLALDSSGNAWVVYLDGHANLRSARRSSGGTWTHSDITSPVSYQSFVLDAQDRPHIAYGDGHLHYVTTSGGFWTFATVDTSGDTGYEPSIAVDAQSNPRMAYWVNGSDDLKLATSSNGTWSITTVDAGVGFAPSLRVDALGSPRVVYYANGSYDRLNFAAEGAGAWKIEMVSTPASRGSLALDGQGAPHTAFQDNDRVVLKYASLGP